MNPPTVVHLKRKGGKVVVDCDVYIGRALYQGGWRLPGSKWANPYKLQTKAGSKTGLQARAQALADYEAHVRGKPELMAALPELSGKRLGCWCTPLPCHGDVIVRLHAESVLAAQGGPSHLPEDSEEDEPALLIPDSDPLWEELGL
jgi:hypothetical protein